MTIIAAFQCADGVLMCADTEETIGDVSKYESDKLRMPRIQGGFALCGGVGDADLIEFAIDRLHDDMFGKKYAWAQVGTVLNKHANDIFKNHIKPYAGFPRDDIPELAFLIAVQMDDKVKLYKWQRNFVRLIPEFYHAAIGVGDIQANPLLREHRFSLPSQNMLFFAARIMHKVKKLVPGCGGKTEARILHPDGKHMGWLTEALGFLERMADILDEFSIHQLMHLVTVTPLKESEEEIEKLIDGLPAEIKRLRSAYFGRT